MCTLRGVAKRVICGGEQTGNRVSEAGRQVERRLYAPGLPSGVSPFIPWICFGTSTTIVPKEGGTQNKASAEWTFRMAAARRGRQFELLLVGSLLLVLVGAEGFDEARTDQVIVCLGV